MENLLFLGVPIKYLSTLGYFLQYTPTPFSENMNNDKSINIPLDKLNWWV